MPNDKESKPSFWSTLPGILTALGALTGASAALITALYTTGVIGSKNKLPDNPPAINSPTAESSPNNKNKLEPAVPAEPSRDFMVGRWQAEQEPTAGVLSGGSVLDFLDDGTFDGTATTFVVGIGRKQRLAGRWDFEKLSKETFRLKLRFDNQSTWLGTFKIIDQDHIHNVKENYISVRIK